MSHLSGLPPFHRDPFDRPLIAQALPPQLHSLPSSSSPAFFKSSGVMTI